VFFYGFLVDNYCFFSVVLVTITTNTMFFLKFYEKLMSKVDENPNRFEL